LYPNPTTDFINFEDGQQRNFQVYDINGGLIKSGFRNEIDLGSYPSGIYTIQYVQEKKMWSERIIKN